MISKLLTYLRNGGDANTATISRKLEIEEGTVAMLLDQLIKLGYLEEINKDQINDDTCPPSKCSSCAKLIDCNTAPTVKYRIVK